MKLYTQLVLLSVLLSICPFQGKAQSQITQRYLFEVGIADSLYSEILEEQRDIWIKLPDYYDPGSHKKYPVIYILDGGVQLRALATVCTYYEGHFLPDMILVGISNRSHRMRDLSTSQIQMRYGGMVNEETGGAENFTRFIESELIPYIDSKLPTSSYRTLIGHSFAGLFTIHTLIKHPNLFANYLAIDPSLDWDDQKLLKEAQLSLKQESYTGKSLYVSLSAASLHMQNGEITMENVMMDTSDYTQFARSIIEFSKFAENQKQNGLNFSWQHYPNDLHGTVPLPSIRDGLTFLFEWYQLESYWKYNDFNTPTDELVELIENRAKKLSAHFGYPSVPMEEELFNMMGYMAMESGQLERSYAVFKMAIEYYPDSPNAYDSMADYYESQNDLANALKYVSKAYELSGAEYYKNRMEEIKNALQ